MQKHSHYLLIFTNEQKQQETNKEKKHLDSY